MDRETAEIRPQPVRPDAINVKHLMRVIRERALSQEESPVLPRSLEIESSRRASEALARYQTPPLPEPGSLPPVPPTLRGRLGVWLVRVVRRALFWYSDQARQWLRESLAWRVLAADAVGEQAEALRRQEARIRDLEAGAAELREQVAACRQMLERRDSGIPPGWPDYHAIEFRDTPGTGGQERFRRYLPTVRDSGAGSAERPILDLGCGYGEWLALLRDEGFVASGVDVSPVMAGRCRRLGLEVTEEDLLDYLRLLPSRGTGMVTAFHVMEHLPPALLPAVFDEISRVLAAGGVVVIETPNPDNILVATQRFHLDLSHQRPLPAALLEYLLRHRGFASAELTWLHAASEADRLPGSDAASVFLNEHFLGPQDYVLVARKA